MTMLRNIGCILLLLVLKWTFVACAGPPRVIGSYLAYGEMVETLEDTSGLLTQIAFEESYDASTKNAAFIVWVMGQQVTFIENFQTNQTYRYSKDVCELVSMDEWIKTKSPPSLLGYEDTNGTIRFSLKQLFALDDKYLKEEKVPTTYRGVPANKWMYEIRGQEKDGQRSVLNIYAYWSDGTWNTSSSGKIAPLGFTVTKMNYIRGKPKVQVHEQFINVYGFVPNTTNHKVFEAKEGYVCPKVKQTIPFPNIKYWKTVSFHSEFVLPDYMEIRYVDTWIDPVSKLVRVDMERIKEEDPTSKIKKYQSEMFIGEMGIVYQITNDKGKSTCQVIPINKYEADIQNLVNFKKPLQLERNMFNLNDTTYVYIGKASKRDMACQMFQGIRKDWPDPSAGITSLWEWCFNVNMTNQGDSVLFSNGEFGLVSANVKILQSGQLNDYPVGYRMIHHFFDVQVKERRYMSATSFDIGRCFNNSMKRHLQFTVNWPINEDTITMVENATSDVNFLALWKNTIYFSTGLPSYSLRITNVRSTVYENKLYIKFTILGIHPGLPNDVKEKQKSAFDAENSLRDNINAGKVQVSYKPSPKEKAIPLSAQQHSLQFQLNRTFIPHTLPIIPSTTPSTRIPFTLLTDPTRNKPSSNDGSTVTPGPTGVKTTKEGVSSSTTSDGKRPQTTSNPIEKKKENKKHGPGAVAGVSVAMLLVGLTIGSTGTLFKYRGLPSFLSS